MGHPRSPEITSLGGGVMIGAAPSGEARLDERQIVRVPSGEAAAAALLLTAQHGGETGNEGELSAQAEAA